MSDAFSDGEVPRMRQSTQSATELPKTASVQEASAVLRAHGIRARYDNYIGGKWAAPTQRGLLR